LSDPPGRRPRLLVWRLAQNTEAPCRSELAREKHQDTTGIQAARVIVDVHREQARTTEEQKKKRGGLTTTECVSPVGASLLAKNARTTRAFRQPALSLTSIASKLAPTEEQKKKRRTPTLFTTQQAER